MHFKTGLVLIIYFHALNTTEINIRTVQAPWTSSVLEVTRGICRAVGLEGVVGLGGERGKYEVLSVRRFVG